MSRGDAPSPTQEPTGVAQPPVFVFGSNLAGRHGKGAALWARQYRGAEYGVGMGRTGHAYAIPTKDENLRTLPLGIIGAHVKHFLAYAAGQPGLMFQLTPIGCGLAGYKPEQIAPMFMDAPSNVLLPDEFATVPAAGQSPTSKSVDGSSQNPSALKDTDQ